MRKILFVTITALLAASSAQAKGVKWMDAPPGLPSGAKVAVVKGDPSKEGDFTLRIWDTIPAHDRKR